MKRNSETHSHILLEYVRASLHLHHIVDDELAVRSKKVASLV